LNIFSVSADEQDVEVLLGNVNKALQAWESGKTLPLDLSLLLHETGKVKQQAAQLRSQWQIDGQAVILSNRPGIGPWVIRFQQLVRRFTWWFMEPILQQIRAFQRNTAVAITDLVNSQEDLIQTGQDQAAELDALREKVAQLEAVLKTSGASAANRE
jgi:hypothetical protein